MVINISIKVRKARRREKLLIKLVSKITKYLLLLNFNFKVNLKKKYHLV